LKLKYNESNNKEYEENKEVESEAEEVISNAYSNDLN
jgi:hypothetical protein